MCEQFHLQMVWPTIFAPGGSLCNAAGEDSMTQTSLLCIYIHLNTVSIDDLALVFYPFGKRLCVKPGLVCPDCGHLPAVEGVDHEWS